MLVRASTRVDMLGKERVDPFAFDPAAVRMELFRNGEPIAEGSDAAVRGHPAEAVARFANTLGWFGIAFRKGDVVPSGSLAALIPLCAGDRFRMNPSGIGSCAVSFEQ